MKNLAKISDAGEFVDSIDDPVIHTIVRSCYGRMFSHSLVHGVEPEYKFDALFYFIAVERSARNLIGNVEPEIVPVERSWWANVGLANEVLRTIEVERTKQLGQLVLGEVSVADDYPYDRFDAGYAIVNIKETFGNVTMWDRILGGDKLGSDDDWFEGWASRF